MRTGLISLLLSVAFAGSSLAAAPNYKVVDRIKVGDGGFDYAVFDTANGRALIARTNYTTVIDAKTGNVSELSSASTGHMAINSRPRAGRGRCMQLGF